MAIATVPDMTTGYAHTLERGRRWAAISDDCWGMEVVDATEELGYLGTRRIDGVMCHVWRLTDGRSAAQTALALIGR